MASSDKNPFLDMFTDFGKSMNLPAPDINGMMEYHRKNLQALQAATQVSSSTAQALLDQQRTALEQTLAEIAETIQDATAGADPADMAQTPMELARKAFEATLQNSREMAEIVQKGNADAFQVLKDRVMESVEELTGKKS
ncbi:phasin family protein [Aestuariivita boseongensis]|uniref:phasin family protein n=1 Tax=Aestuariivita boseongensis TaxID=1470562 RepID=UPI0006832932|nr:TIGR01841 family phasin [Aestuariivita boseongensis]